MGRSCFINLYVTIMPFFLFMLTAFLAQPDPSSVLVSSIRLTADVPESEDFFGASVAIEMQHALVGSPGDGDAGFGAGRVAAFRWDEQGEAWVAVPFPLPEGLPAFAHFGAAIALDGHTAVVGAPGEQVVYVFAYDSAAQGWHETARLVPSDPWAGGFGLALAIQDHRVLVGAPIDGERGPFAGAAFIFEQTAEGTWCRRKKLLPEAGGGAMEFGKTVALDGARALVGAPGDRRQGFGAGAAYLFEPEATGTRWHQTTVFHARAGKAFDRFGEAVTLADGIVAIGAPGEDARVRDGGAVHTFSLDRETWIPTNRLVAPEANSTMKFGRSVTLQGGRLLVGASNAALLYHSTAEPKTWMLSEQWSGKSLDTNAALGGAVSLSPRHALVGAVGVDHAGPYAGAVYVFDY